MNLKEALPKPGQAPLGGVSPEQSKVLVQGFGTLNYGQVVKEVEKYTKALLEILPVINGANYMNQTSSAHKDEYKKYGQHNLKVCSEKLNSLLPALVKHLDTKGK